MKNINRDYLVTVQAKTAKISAPTGMKFFMTDVRTSNIFFLLEFNDVNYDPKDKTVSSMLDLIDKHAYKESADDYELTLRVVKPNNEPKIIEVKRLDKDTNFFYVDLIAEEHIDVPGIYQCELFVDTEVLGEDDVLYVERSTSDSFTYEVRKSVFHNLDEVVDTKFLSMDNIATIDYVNSLAVKGASLDGYATNEELDGKANKDHTHSNYITKEQLDLTLEQIDCAKLNLVDFVASNSISIDRLEGSVIGDYSTAEGNDTAATGYASHSEGYRTIAGGDFSHAEGNRTKAINYSAHAEGTLTMANQEAAHAEGYETLAVGYASHSEGYHTIAKGNYQHVQGKYNIEDETTYAHIVGNGTENNPQNIHTLDWDGNAWFANNVRVGPKNQILATKDYVISAIANAGGSFPGGDEGGDNGGNIIIPDEIELMTALEKKADKKIVADKYDAVNSINIGDIDLDDERLGNKRQIRITNPASQLDVKLPEKIDAEFAEVHIFVMPAEKDINLFISINNETNHDKLKYQRDGLVPIYLMAGTVYEYILTYIDYGDDTGRWLVGAIIYE